MNKADKAQGREILETLQRIQDVLNANPQKVREGYQGKDGWVNPVQYWPHESITRAFPAGFAMDQHSGITGTLSGGTAIHTTPDALPDLIRDCKRNWSPRTFSRQPRPGGHRERFPFFADRMWAKIHGVPVKREVDYMADAMHNLEQALASGHPPLIAAMRTQVEQLKEKIGHREWWDHVRSMIQTGAIPAKLDPGAMQAFRDIIKGPGTNKEKEALAAPLIASMPFQFPHYQEALRSEGLLPRPPQPAPKLQQVHPEPIQPERMEQTMPIEKAAIAFAKQIRELLSEEELADVIAHNDKARARGTLKWKCRSTKYLDNTMEVLEWSWEQVTGAPADLATKEGQTAYNDSFILARDSGYDPEAITKVADAA